MKQKQRCLALLCFALPCLAAIVSFLHHGFVINVMSSLLESSALPRESKELAALVAVAERRNNEQLLLNKQLELQSTAPLSPSNIVSSAAAAANASTTFSFQSHEANNSVSSSASNVDYSAIINSYQSILLKPPALYSRLAELTDQSILGKKYLVSGSFDLQKSGEKAWKRRVLQLFNNGLLKRAENIAQFNQTGQYKLMKIIYSAYDHDQNEQDNWNNNSSENSHELSYMEPSQTMTSNTLNSINITANDNFNVSEGKHLRIAAETLYFYSRIYTAQSCYILRSVSRTLLLKFHNAILQATKQFYLNEEWRSKLEAARLLFINDKLVQDYNYKQQAEIVLSYSGLGISNEERNVKRVQFSGTMQLLNREKKWEELYFTLVDQHIAYYKHQKDHQPMDRILLKNAAVQVHNPSLRRGEAILLLANPIQSLTLKCKHTVIASEW
jgi:hypothetical protein